MTRLKNTNNISADGIRDTFLNTSGNGSTSSTALGDTKIWERQPQRNGSANTGTSNTSTNKYSDFGGSMKFIGASASFQIGSSKGAISNNLVGWGTVGGCQGASAGGLSNTQLGYLYDGTTTYTTSAKPFDQLGSFDGNKWVSFIGHLTTGGFEPITAAKVCFEGAGAQTTDTDWDYIYFEADLETTNGQSFYDSYLSSANGQRLARADASVTTESSRIVYTWSNQILTLVPTGGADFVNYVKFE